jgi:hypothetical protein
MLGYPVGGRTCGFCAGRPSAFMIIVTYLQVVRVLHDRRQMEQQIETLLRGLGL